MELLPVVVPGQAIYYLLIDETRDRWIAPHIRDNRMWEAAETSLFLRLVQPGDRVVDVGAHVGYFTILFSRLCGENGFVHAFEPEPANHRLLRANLLVNDCRNVEALQFALSDGAGSAQLYLSADNSGDHRLQFSEGRSSLGVSTVELDTVIGEGRVDIIKMDAQGAEPRILAGMQKLVARERAHLCVLMEFSPGLIARDGSVAAFAAQLDALGARVCAVSLSGEGPKARVSLQAGATTAELLRMLAERLARDGYVDASANLLVFFSTEAQSAHMTRLG